MHRRTCSSNHACHPSECLRNRRRPRWRLFRAQHPYLNACWDNTARRALGSIARGGNDAQIECTHDGKRGQKCAVVAGMRGCGTRLRPGCRQAPAVSRQTWRSTRTDPQSSPNTRRVSAMLPMLFIFAQHPPFSWHILTNLFEKTWKWRGWTQGDCSTPGVLYPPLSAYGVAGNMWICAKSLTRGTPSLCDNNYANLSPPFLGDLA